jgi:IS5 family transposase
MLFVAFLYERSDREMEELATYDIRVKHFLGLPINGIAPDHSSLCRFREEVLVAFSEKFLSRIFEHVLVTAKAHGICFGRVYAIDGAHVASSINGKSDTHDVKTYGTNSKDPDAAWGCKGHESKITKDGKKVQVAKTFFGYKMHALCETKHGLVTCVSVTPGNVADLDGADVLIHRLLTQKQRNAIDVLLADKGYGCPVFINYLEKYDGIMTAFSLPEWMTNKGEHQDKWLAYKQDAGRQVFYKERTVIERIFGDTKTHHDMGRARYTGLTKTSLQVILTIMVHNVKSILKTIAGVRFKPI